MKNLLLLFLSFAFLISCTDNRKRQNEKESVSRVKESTDSVKVISEPESKTELGNGSFTLKAKFINFRLGDAEHYGFEDDSGKYWNFAGCRDETHYFAEELDDNETDESNQGWGPNKELQGKWFLLTIVKEEQPEYIDGPMAMVDIIQEATLIKE
ncbi:MAG: hypothetical protein R8G66_18095 [Cytophagales bacterium]|nr:hypothetical protein [Cytophagales bacterium]